MCVGWWDNSLLLSSPTNFTTFLLNSLHCGQLVHRLAFAFITLSFLSIAGLLRTTAVVSKLATFVEFIIILLSSAGDGGTGLFHSKVGRIRMQICMRLVFAAA